MAHNLATTNGKTALFVVKEKAWHQLGKVLDAPPTSKEAIKEAGLDYVVQKMPIPNPFDAEKVIKERYFTYRKDDNRILGIVGSKYEIMQNIDGFEFFDSIVGEGEAIYETAGALGDGEVVFITAKLPGYITVGNSDNIEKYLLLSLSHDGSSPITAMFTPVRVVCNNTLHWALSDKHQQKVKIRHTKNASSKLEEAHRILGISNMLTDQLGLKFNKMSKTLITDDKFGTYVDKVFGKDSIETKDQSTRYGNIKLEVFNYFKNGAGQQQKTCNNTVFGAYNAITGYFNNVIELSDKKATSNLIGGNANIMRKAFELADVLAS